MRVRFSGVRQSVVALALYGCLSVSAAAGEDAMTRANRSAYEAAMTCFVANGIVTGDKRQSGDKKQEAVFEAKARQSFDIAVQLGHKLGYSGTHINEDFGLAQAREIGRLMTDSAYFRRTAATCKALGLM